MRKQMMCSLQKDVMEYVRNKKFLLFSSTIFFLCVFVLLATKMLPMLINTLINNAPYIVSDKDMLTSTMMSFFPEKLKANMGILSSDIIIFYGIVTILSTCNLIKNEIIKGMWIFPLSVGYKPFILIISKGIVYGTGAAFPSIIFYYTYYLIGNIYLLPDYSNTSAFANALVLGFTIFAVVYITIMLSTIYRRTIMAAVTMISLVAIAPDFLSLFKFGRYLPTYILTYLYQTKNLYTELVIPILITILIMFFLSVVVSKKSLNIEVIR